MFSTFQDSCNKYNFSQLCGLRGTLVTGYDFLVTTKQMNTTKAGHDERLFYPNRKRNHILTMNVQFIQYPSFTDPITHWSNQPHKSMPEDSPVRLIV